LTRETLTSRDRGMGHVQKEGPRMTSSVNRTR